LSTEYRKLFGRVFLAHPNAYTESGVKEKGKSAYGINWGLQNSK
jgi:hypothetical protein